MSHAESIEFLLLSLHGNKELPYNISKVNSRSSLAGMNMGLVTVLCT